MRMIRPVSAVIASILCFPLGGRASESLLRKAPEGLGMAAVAAVADALDHVEDQLAPLEDSKGRAFCLNSPEVPGRVHCFLPGLFDGPPKDPVLLEQWQKKQQELRQELQRRAEEARKRLEDLSK